MKRYLVSPEFAQALIDYLATKPFGEVAALVEGFKQCQLVDVTVNEATPEVPVETAEATQEAVTPEVIEA